MTTISETINQTDQILALNYKYLISHIQLGDYPKGFVRIAYDREEINHLIREREITVIIDNGYIVAYYLIGRKSQSPLLDYQKNKALRLSDETEILYNKIGYGCQVVIEEKYRSKGLFAKMLADLIDIVRHKYDYLMCAVSESNNTSNQAHIHNGWRLLDKEGPTNFYLYTINKDKSI